jgi:serine/threonine protein kinase
MSHLNQVVNGVKYLHGLKKPLVHGDLKGENIFLAKDNEIFEIGDLDNSVVLENGQTDATGIMKRVGTWFHMSPEMIECSKFGLPIGRTTDIWSVGCVALEILQKGELRYLAKDGTELPTGMTFDTFKEKVKEGGFLDLSSLEASKISNDSLNTIIKQCLSRDSKDRPEAADLLSKLETTNK